MKRFLSSKLIVAVLSICILSVSLVLYVDAAADVNAIREKCEDYCKIYSDPFDNMACMTGCIAGHMI